MIWRHVLHEALERKNLIFTQKELAAQFCFSTSTVFHALEIPRKLGAVEVRGRFFRLRDMEKLLLLWATQRNFHDDIIYSEFVPFPVREIEGMMPPDVIFAAFSAFRLKYQEAPADYSAVYVYSDSFEKIRGRFSSAVAGKDKGAQNLFVLRQDSYLSSFGAYTPDVQTFVDLWNLSDWYAKDFLEALRKKMNI